MNTDELGVRDHLHVIGAAPAHPAVGDRDNCYPARRRLVDGGASGVVHHQHADIVAAVIERRDLGLSQHLHWVARLFEPMLRILASPEYSYPHSAASIT